MAKVNDRVMVKKEAQEQLEELLQPIWDKVGFYHYILRGKGKPVELKPEDLNSCTSILEAKSILKKMEEKLAV